MNVKRTEVYTEHKHTFSIKKGGVLYQAEVWLNAKGKFIDTVITRADGKPTSAKINDEIEQYLSDNWDEIASEDSE